MKFKNFDIADVFGPADIKEAEKRVGEIGYFEDSLEDLDNAITWFPKKIFKLIRIKQANSDSKYVVNNACSFKYFLSLNNLNIKKTKPVETKEKMYRPIKNMFEFSYILGGTDWEVPFSVGDRFLIRRKQDKHQLKILLTAIEFNDNHEIVFINGMTPQALLEDYELEDISGKFIPFGVEVKDEY